MYKALLVILEDSFYETYNGILFFLQKIPLFGKLFKDKLYKVGLLARFAVFLGVIFEFVSSIIKKIAYYFVIKYILKYIFKNFDLILSKEYLLSFLIVLSVVGFVETLDYFSGSKQAYIFVKLMRINPKDYYRANIYYELVFNIISYSLVFGIIFFDLGISFIDSFSYACLLFGLRIFAKLAFARTLKYKKEKIRDRFNLTLTCLFISIALIYLVYSIFFLSKGKTLFWQNYFTYNRTIFSILGISSLILASLVLYRTSILENIAKYTLRKEIFAVDMDQAVFASYGFDEKDINQSQIKIGQFENYKAIEYINMIFFQRFNYKFLKPVKIKTTIILFVGIVANILVSRFSISDKESLEFFTYGFCIVGFLAGFLIYIGDKFTRLCFYNMDRFLMKNNFYRSPKLLKDAIKIRFKKMVAYNLPMLIVFSLAMVGILFQVKVPWFSYLITLIFSVLGMVFFNFHYLYAYYLIQPFTENMQMKNPLYAIFNIFSYYISIMLIMAVKNYRWIALISILILAIFYIGLGFLLVSKFSYKRFKLR
ncbi:MAG: hypothetical protein PUG67_04565 [Peptoniphilaceae bacterium]|nr:hypothetical protein [Peptoniphilaceae bacterium]MDY6018961.1 hypothetical protein [Anaerococcus sp.]